MPNLGCFLSAVLCVRWRFQARGWAGRELLSRSVSPPPGPALLLPPLGPWVLFSSFSARFGRPTTSRTVPFGYYAHSELGRRFEPPLCLSAELRGSWNCFFLMKASFWFNSFICWLFCSAVIVLLALGLAGELLDN